MADDNDLLVYDDGPIRHLRFNRPHVLNAMDLAQHERVLAALREAEQKAHVRVVAFSGEGRAFSAGDDMKRMARDGAAGELGRWPERYRPRLVDLEVGIGPLLLQEVTSYIRQFPKPTVALIHGHALGAGYDYATSCDFRVAVEDCAFGDPRIRNAMWMAEGWSYKITRLVPFGRMPRIEYLGESMDGREGYEIGLFHRIYPTGADLRVAAREFLLRLATVHPAAYASAKQKLLRQLDQAYESA